MWRSTSEVEHSVQVPELLWKEEGVNHGDIALSVSPLSIDVAL